MILKDRVFPIGKVIRPHGINGEMSFNFTSDVFDAQEVPFFIFEKDGILVPFFIESYRFKSDTTALLKLQDINTEEEAREFSGQTVYLPDEYLETVSENEIDPDYFNGFMLIDIEKGEIGPVSEVDRTTENILFVVSRGEEEILIPAGGDYIVEIDHDSKKIILQLPEGLLDL
jgi:16S rRNA processing protein RimM